MTGLSTMSSGLTFHADATEGGSRRLLAAVELEGPFPTGRVDLSFPRWIPGSYTLRDPVQYVDGIEATDENGQVLSWQRPDPHRLRVKVPPSVKRVRIQHEVMALEMTVRSTHLDDGHLHLMPPFTWYLPDDADWSKGAEVHLNLPDAWTPYTQLEAVQGRTSAGHVFHAPDRDAFLDGIIEANAGPSRAWDVDGRPHVLNIWDSAGLPVSSDMIDRFVEDATKIIKEHHALFGVPTKDPYVTVLHLTDTMRGGLEHLGSQTSMMPRASLIDGEKALYRDLISLFSHEYLHQWNVKRLRPKVYLEYDLSKEIPSPLLWWFEGGTSWLGDLICLRSGAWTEENWREEFNLKVNRHLNRHGAAHESLAESSESAWTHLYKRTAWSSERRINYYLEGEFAMMALDVELRRRTRGARGLDDVMVEALRRHAVNAEEPGVDHRRLRQALTSTEGGRRLGGMLDELMTTRSAPPLASTLKTLGLNLAPKEDGEEHDGWLGIGLRSRQGKVVVTTHLEGSPLRNHVDAGDEIVAINDRRITEIKHVKQALSRCANQKVQVLTSREGGLRRCTVMARAAADHRKVEVSGKGNALWRRITASRQQDA